MKNSKFKIQNFCCLFFVFCFVFGITEAFSQSTNQNFPTPVTSNEINGTIKARDVGDARLTNYFYVFNGNQGDVFINVVTKNLDGDIDVFTADNLRPLTKIVVYSDNSDNETGRVIYLRQPQKLILRIEGRTPNDAPATYRIKFAGSFVPVSGATAETDESTKMPEVKTDEQGEVRVNSVGTIIEVKPKPTPVSKETTAKTEPEEPKKTDETAKIENEEKKEIKEENKETKGEAEVKKETTDEKKDEKKFEVVITDNLPVAENKTETEEKKPTTKTTTKRNIRSKKTRTPTTPKTETKTKTIAPVEPSQLENIRLVIVFKDGGKIERPMSEILKVGVDKGILTIIFKDGSIARYSILDVEKMTIE